MVGLSAAWQLRWKFFLMFLCVIVASAHRTAQVINGNARAGTQAALGFAMVGGLLALALKALGLAARLAARKPRPRAAPWLGTKSSIVGLFALAVAIFGGLEMQPFLVEIATLACTLVMLGLAVREARAERLGAAQEQAEPPPRPQW
jgi:hypothetical protein